MFASSSGEEAKKLFNDAQDMLKAILETKSLQPTGIVAFFPANSVGDDIHIFEDDNKREGSPRAVFYGLRQQVGRHSVQTISYLEIALRSVISNLNCFLSGSSQVSC